MTPSTQDARATGLVEREWRCFHCDDVFTSARDARDHFGPDEGHVPACRIKASEGGLLHALREAEASACEAWDAVHAESAEGVKAYRANLSRHYAAIRAAEESGYEKGLADGRALAASTKDMNHDG